RGAKPRPAWRSTHRTRNPASAIVISPPEAVARLSEHFPELTDRPVVAIPNGFDKGDFDGEPRQRTDQKFRIVHAGYLHTALGEQHRRRRLIRNALRGSVPGLDILTRSHVYLIDALNVLLKQDPGLGGLVEVLRGGVRSGAARAAAPPSPVTTHGFVTPGDTITLMQPADLLFLPMQNLPVGTGAT